MIRKYHNHTQQNKPRHREEESHNTYSHKESGRQLRYSSIKLIAKLERTLSTTQQNKDQTQSPYKQWEQQLTKNQQ